VFKENDGFAIVPVHRTVGMDGRVQAAWFTRDITAKDGEHYRGGRGIVAFNDGEVRSLQLKQISTSSCKCFKTYYYHPT